MPVLGICYGAQLIARQLGGRVDNTGQGEYGRTTLTLTSNGPAPSVLFGSVPPEFDVWMSHFDAIAEASARREIDRQRALAAARPMAVAQRLVEGEGAVGGAGDGEARDPADGPERGERLVIAQPPARLGVEMHCRRPAG